MKGTVVTEEDVLRDFAVETFDSTLHSYSPETFRAAARCPSTLLLSECVRHYNARMTRDRSGDAVDAARYAAHSVEGLRGAAQRKLPGGQLAVSQINERDFLDEIVSVP